MAKQTSKNIKVTGKLTGKPDGVKSPGGRPTDGIPVPGASDRAVKNPVTTPNPLTEGGA